MYWLLRQEYSVPIKNHRGQLMHYLQALTDVSSVFPDMLVAQCDLCPALSNHIKILAEMSAHERKRK